MRNRTLSRALMVLACTAAFTFVAAQYPWETGYSESSSDESSSGSSASESSDVSPYDMSYGSSDDSGGSSGDESEAESASVPAKEVKAKPEKVKKERAKRERSGGASSVAFSGPQKTCPVCASARLKGNLYVDGGGGRIHVCSAACIDRVRRNPSKFADILQKRGEQLASQ